MDLKKPNGSYGFPRMDPTKFAAKTVNFEFFSTFPFFESALMLPRTDQIKLVCISVRGSWSISLLSFFRLRTVVVVGSLYWARSRLQPSTFRILFPTYLESVPPPVACLLSVPTSKRVEAATFKYCGKTFHNFDLKP